MRRGLLFHNRIDFVATLLQQGRLVDIMMLQHFAAASNGAAVDGLTAAVKRQKAEWQRVQSPDALRLAVEAGTSAATGADVSGATATAEDYVLGAAACGGVLAKLEEICALHATHTARYDALLVRNPAVQRRISQLACARLAVDTLSSFVVGAAADGPLPLVESVALCMHARHALAAGVKGAREILHGCTEEQAVPHSSNLERLIDYAYARQLFESERHVLSRFGGSTAAQSVRHFLPLLAAAKQRDDAANVIGGGSFIARLLESGNGAVRLVAPHINLRVNAAALEKDVEALLYRIRSQKDREDPLFVLAVAQYTAEIFANVAIMYRATASLSRDDDNASREWLLTQAFCVESAAQRKMFFSDFKVSCAAKKAFSGASGFRDSTTHPVELMNAEPARRTKEAKAGTAEMKMAN